MFKRTELSCESMGEAAERGGGLWAPVVGTLLVLTLSFLPALVGGGAGRALPDVLDRLVRLR